MRSLRTHFGRTVAILGVGFTLLVVLSTWFELPSDPELRSAMYVVVGLLLSLPIAVLANRGQQELNDEQARIGEFLMQRVTNRPDRTMTVISLCESAKQEFRAVTYFPAVGIHDDPESSPDTYLNALEKALKQNVNVTLVSISCDEARLYCEDRGFDGACLQALSWVESRLNILNDRFAKLTVINLPGSAITVNVCHNDSAALLYHINLKEDVGMGFKSNDPRVVDLAKGGADRYITFGRRNGGGVLG